ncbi:MAG TPA: hypothetical protein RMH80_02760, partial [Polyangiaceae bacterium LLY-WYZ-15_(1-7)]|nr:hypothetical protein [Polyangiaceae bacterium LLY-WYZ-15_(1-7)]
GGSPFFVEELARHVGDAPRSEPDALELDEVLWQRIAALPPTPRHVLELVCTASGQSTRARIAHAAGLDEQALFEATRSLRAAHLVRATGLRRDDTLEPYHDRVRDAVERHLDPRRRRLCHQRLARALAEDGGARVAPHALVGHTLAAGDQAGAAKHAEEAAKHARAATAFDRAADFYRMALDLGGHDAERARALRLELARALAEAGRGAESADAYEAAAEGADEATRRDCQRLAAEQLLISGHIERGVARLDDALEALGEPPLATPRRALFAVLWRRLGLRLRGLSWSERAPEEVPAEERARLQLIGASALGLSMVDAIRGAAFSARFAQLALRSGDPFEVARALGSEANMSSYQARFRRARRFMDALAELTERHPDEPYLQGWVAATRGGFAYFRGEFAECEAHMQAALAGFGRVRGATWERNNSNLFALFGLRYQGRLRELARQVAALQRDAERRGDLYMKVNLQRYGGHYGALLADRPEEAWENLERAVWPAPAETFHLQDWQRLEARCSILLYEGRAADGRERAEAELAALDGSLLTRIHTIRSSAAFIRGRLLLGSAPDEGERRAVRRLARGLARRGGFVAAFGALLRAGEAEQRGDREAVVEAYRAALAIAERHGMGFHRAVIQRRLAEQLGGDEGRALRAASDTWMQAQGVVAPERMAQLLVPRPTRRLSAVGDALDGLGRETD